MSILHHAIPNDPYYNDAVLLLRGYDATSGQVFKDYSKYNRTITANGNVAHSTTQKKYGNSSIYLGGSGDYLSALSSTDFNVGTGDISICFWAYFLSLSGVRGVFNREVKLSLTQWSGYGMYTNENNLIFQIFQTNSNISVSIQAPISTGQWYFIVAKRINGVMSLSVNGSLISSNNCNYNLDYPVPFYVGSFEGIFYSNFYGFIEDFRVTKGVARPIQVPTQPFPNW